MASATQDNKCENCQKVFQNVRLKRLPVCSHKVCSKCNPVLLRKQGKLKEDQLCPVCAKKPPVQFVRQKHRPKVTPREGQATSQLTADNTRRDDQADEAQTAESENCGQLADDKEVEEETDCAICTEVLKEPITLPCEHQFCKECYEKWEERASTCPLCRTVVNEEKQRRLMEAQNARRLQRRTRTTRSVQPPFPDPLFNTKPASAIATSLLMLPMFAMFTCGNFAVKHCHALMFTGFPFWT
ncbi:uncharacterized protein LOC142357220, partial [Convolutriloba macropyga]|uniref:uncharacterized protein LOC142357220 n=1 Tax=Convolutriloba macropyga TaxID=536237 RepID=UPI003F522F17